MSGHHRLRVVRQTDAHQLPHRSAPGLRVLAPRRPAHHPDVPLGGRGHRRRRGRRPAAGRAEPARGGAGAGRRRRGRRPTPPPRSRRRTRRRACPLRGRPRGPRASTPSSPKTVWWQELGRRWESKLAALAEAEQALAATRALPPLPDRAELERLAADLPRLWSEPTTSNKDRKRLLRTLIADITLLPEPDQAKARIGIAWPAPPTTSPSPASTHPGTANAARHRGGDGDPPRTHHLHRRVGRPAQRRRAHHRHRSTVRRQGRAVDPPPTTSPPRTPTPTARSVSPRPPTGSAAAPAWSTTGSRPANSPPAAAPATGCASLD